MKRSLRLLSMCLTLSLLTSTGYAKNFSDTEKVEGHGPNAGLVFDPNKDYDKDGLSNAQEDKLGLFILEADTDFDSFPDNEENQKYGTDPTKADTDGDGLDDQVEVEDFHTDPLNPDQNNDGILDGAEERTVQIPENKFGITGTVTGTGPILRQFLIKENPIIMLNQVSSLKTVYLSTKNKDLRFNISIPYDEDATKVKDPKLFTYDFGMGKVKPVEKVKSAKGKFEADLIGGGVLLVASDSQFKQSIPQNIPEKDIRKEKPKGKVKIANFPGLEIDAERIKDKPKKSDLIVELDPSLEEIPETGVISFEETKQKEGKSKTYQALYKVNKFYSDGTNNIVTLSAITTESGNTPAIMVHGLWGHHGTWGYANSWYNTEPKPKAAGYIATFQTYTGKSYDSYSYSTYSNVDVHKINSTSDYAELGAVLESSHYYTANSDLFAFEYHNELAAHVGEAAQHLKNFISGMKSIGKIGQYQVVNLLAHSKGGLVSRYYIENLSGSSSVKRLITLGTPHFGSSLSTYDDMDRDDSELWNTKTDTDPYCSPFTNQHSYTHYFIFGGFDPGYDKINDKVRGFNFVGWLSGSYDKDVRNRFLNAGISLTYEDITDDVINIDTAMGSDQDPDYNFNLPKIAANDRVYLFHETYGNHSKMRKYPYMDDYVAQMLEGSWDY
ncbi:esterase/lipase family protein [Effusibacillus consociatus]|uniref:Alpha/beta hydrolase n=1 Tax=Effusibacillus consociatus TaxID=1117041 RepID=A0ABV9Q9N5_9BACL